MKKGLRPASAGVQTGIENGHRPYEEGIKTRGARGVSLWRMNGHRPYEEGIKTRSDWYVCGLFANGHRPYEEGIKTEVNRRSWPSDTERTQTL